MIKKPALPDYNQPIVIASGQMLFHRLDVFDPAEAAPPQRREFRGFIEQSMETIAEFSGLHQGQACRM